MTDTWAETIDKLNTASQPAHETLPGAAETPQPIDGAETWQPYASPSVAPAAGAVPLTDPLILEVEQTAHESAPALLEPEPAAHAPPTGSVYGHVDTPLPEPIPAPPPSFLEPAPPVTAPEPASVLELSEPLDPPAAIGLPVAHTVKPVEPAPKPAESVLFAALTPPPAPVVAVEAPPQPASPTVTAAPVVHTAAPRDAIDPVLAGFDHVVALAGYVLLFISVFMFGVPALATMALAYAHKNDSHLLVRSHYRFQLRIFWTAVLFAMLAIGSAVTAGGLAISKLVDFAREHLPGVGAAMDRVGSASWSGEIAGVLLIAAVTLAALAAIWTLVASLFGFLRLLGNRPIGHQYAAK